MKNNTNVMDHGAHFEYQFSFAAEIGSWPASLCKSGRRQRGNGQHLVTLICY